jgi:uncharacterized protein (DUF58 family)
MNGMLGLLGRERTPSRPGPGPTPEALLRALDVTIGRRIHGLVPGAFRAHEIGGGTELAQVRPYEPGDDVRRIDWNVTARTATPHVRVHVPERALTTWLLVDVSPSMAFGTAQRRKADVVEGVAVAIGNIATQRGNRLSVLTFGDGRDTWSPARGGRAGLVALLSTQVGDIGDSAPAPAESRSPAAALRFLAHGAQRGGQVVLVSDFRGTREWHPLLAAVAARHHLLAIEIRDPREDELPDVGELTLVDAETGREIRVDTSSRRLRSAFGSAAAAERRALAQELRRLGAGHIVLDTAGSWLRSLAAQLRTGGQRP